MMITRKFNSTSEICIVARHYCEKVLEGHANLTKNIINALNSDAKIRIKTITFEHEIHYWPTKNLTQTPFIINIHKSPMLWSLSFRLGFLDLVGATMCKLKLLRDDFDLIYLLNVNHTPFLIALWRKAPIIVHLWSFKPSLMYVSLLNSLSEKVIFTSKYLLERYQQLSFRKKSSVIPPPVDTNLFRPRDKFRARSTLNLPLDATLIGYIGQLIPERGIITLLKAFKEIRDAKLVLVTPTPFIEFKEIVPYLKRLKHKIILLKCLNEPELFYNAVDIMVLPFSKPYGVTEPPLVVLEALASGSPLITTPVGSVKEVTKNKLNAIHIKPGDWKGLVKAIIELTKEGNLMEELGKNAREYALEAHSFSKVKAEILSALKSV